MSNPTDKTDWSSDVTINLDDFKIMNDQAILDNMIYSMDYTYTSPPLTGTSSYITSSSIWSTVTTLDIGTDSIVWTATPDIEFETCMPPLSTIKDMCEIYPGLKKAFDHFKDIYDLVKDDFQARITKDE